MCTMSDLLADRISLAGFQGLAPAAVFPTATCSVRRGWAKTILFNARLSDAFAAFFGRGDTFALGACNGCQMMSQLKTMIPGARHWPRFFPNASEQFEPDW